MKVIDASFYYKSNSFCINKQEHFAKLLWKMNTRNAQILIIYFFHSRTEGTSDKIYISVYAKVRYKFFTYYFLFEWASNTVQVAKIRVDYLPALFRFAYCHVTAQLLLALTLSGRINGALSYAAALAVVSCRLSSDGVLVGLRFKRCNSPIKKDYTTSFIVTSDYETYHTIKAAKTETVVMMRPVYHDINKSEGLVPRQYVIYVCYIIICCTAIYLVYSVVLIWIYGFIVIDIYRYIQNSTLHKTSLCNNWIQ